MPSGVTQRNKSRAFCSFPRPSAKTDALKSFIARFDFLRGRQDGGGTRFSQAALPCWATNASICDGFIRKPFNRSELIAELKRFLKLLAPAPLGSAPAPAVPKAAVTGPVSAAALARRPELLAKLREQEQQVWPKLVRALAMAKVEEFARRLKGRAEGGMANAQGLCRDDGTAGTGIRFGQLAHDDAEVSRYLP